MFGSGILITLPLNVSVGPGDLVLVYRWTSSDAQYELMSNGFVVNNAIQFSVSYLFVGDAPVQKRGTFEIKKLFFLAI
jgi:hypothetical protein